MRQLRELVAGDAGVDRRRSASRLAADIVLPVVHRRAAATSEPSARPSRPRPPTATSAWSAASRASSTPSGRSAPGVTPTAAAVGDRARRLGRRHSRAVLHGVAGQRHERLLQRRAAAASARAARSRARGGELADPLGARPRTSSTPRSALETSTPSADQHARAARRRPACGRARPRRARPGRRLLRRSCRRSAGRGRRRPGARRSAPSRSSGATTGTRCAPRRRGRLSSVRIQRMPSGSRPLTGSSSITVGGIAEQRAGDAEPLAHAERERCPARLRATAAQPHQLDHLVDPRRRPMPWVCAIASRWWYAERPVWIARASSSVPTSRSGARSSR